uniref:NAD(P)-bd_dom domain-containing protein n=1 Tax=Heligmosomoides polygyrus TaxID=6339 RepID=A0A183GWY8_HELPZ
LLDMKREARNSEKTRKVLRADKHFDSILNDMEEEDLGSARFVLCVLRADKHFDSILNDMEEEDLGSARFVLCGSRLRSEHCCTPCIAENDKDPMKADVKTVEFLLSYKQRDVEKIRRSHKLRRRDAEVLIVHSHVLIVVGSLLSFQVIRVIIAAEMLDPRADSEGRSSSHKILFYGLLLETTKPYICNVLPVPAAALLLFAKKVVFRIVY